MQMYQPVLRTTSIEWEGQPEQVYGCVHVAMSFLCVDQIYPMCECLCKWITYASVLLNVTGLIIVNF